MVDTGHANNPRRRSPARAQRHHVRSSDSARSINCKTLAEGESVKLAMKPCVLTINCLKIHKDSVLVSIESEDRPRLLRLK